MKKNMVRLSNLEKEQLNKLRNILMDKGLNIVREIGLEAPEDFSYGAIIKLCADAIIKYINENKRM